MSKRWSKLQREIYDLIDSEINLQIHCSIYRMSSQNGSTDLPRYWITLGKEIIFDYPKQFLEKKLSDYGRNKPRPKYQTVERMYPYTTDIDTISNIIRDYIDSPLDTLLSLNFEFDNWGLTDILKAADRRIGKTKLSEHFRDTDNETIRKIMKARGIV